MKSTSDILNKTNENNLIVYYNEALKDEDFIKLLTKLKIKENIAKRYTTKLEQTCSDLKKCRSCKSINECKNQVKGYVYYPAIAGENLRFDYVACKYKKEELEAVNTKTKMFNEPDQIKAAKMANIDLTDKKRIAVVKWVNKFYKEYKNDKHIKGLFLHGSFGSGKTYILAALLNELSNDNAKCIITYFPELLRTLKEAFDDSDEFSLIMDQIKNCDVLLLDDLGAENLTNWSRDEILSTILQYRMDSKLPTFITSNLNIEELEMHLSKGGLEIVKAKRIIERIKFLTEDIELISENRRK